VIDRRYRPGHRHGRLTLVDHVVPEEPEPWRVLLAPSCPPDRFEPGRALFIDLETTGLAGGAGTYAFLVGFGWFERTSFHVRQFLMTSHAAEPALLHAVTALASDAHVVVSYNGKTFDLPLIETRFLFNRLSPPFADVPHLDMLHQARRLWRTDDHADQADAAGCRLSVLEQSVCGHTRDGDVPGFDIPSRYFHYVRTGDARPLAGVIEHNRLDLLSLAMLTARAARLVEEGARSARTAREAIGLGRLYERAGMPHKAIPCFARASGLDASGALPGDHSTKAEALRAYARSSRRARAHADAARAWSALLGMPQCPPRILGEAAEALAVHHEHRLRDPRQAHALALTSLPLQRSTARRQAVEHRLARLDRKMNVRPDIAALF
jgi:uncharacterized protein YprB with RNaseH-like and TPR domain